MFLKFLEKFFMLKREFVIEKIKEGKKSDGFDQEVIDKNINNGENQFSLCEDPDFINGTNLALERMDKSDMKALSKEEFLKELKTW